MTSFKAEVTCPSACGGFSRAWRNACHRVPVMTRNGGKSLIDQGDAHAVPLLPVDLGIGRKQLGTLASYRHELHSIYQAVARGELQSEIGTKLRWMIGQMRVALGG